MLCVFDVSRLQCLQLSLRTRFPFHDSQVLCWSYKSPQERPKRRPRGPKSAKRPPRDAKTAPRGAKRAPRGAKTRPRAIWEPFGLDLRSPGDAQTLIFAATVVENQGFRVFPKASEKETQTGPKGGPWVTKMAPRSAPGGPGTAQEAPRERQERPRATQERPESRPRGQKKEQLRSPLPFALSGGGPGAPWATLERFWSDLGAPGGAFSSHFRSILLCLKRCVEPARARGVPSDTPPRR